MVSAEQSKRAIADRTHHETLPSTGFAPIPQNMGMHTAQLILTPQARSLNSSASLAQWTGTEHRPPSVLQRSACCVHGPKGQYNSAQCGVLLTHLELLRLIRTPSEDVRGTTTLFGDEALALGRSSTSQHMQTTCITALDAVDMQLCRKPHPLCRKRSPDDCNNCIHSYSKR